MRSQATSIARTKKRHVKRTRSIYQFASVFVYAALVLFCINIFVLRTACVDGVSMFPTLQHRDFLVILSTLHTRPMAGDIVVISQPDHFTKQTPEKPLVKRVIAVGGDTVDIDFKTGVVYVNEKALNEPYTLEPIREPGKLPTAFPLEVPEGSIFVLGDNRNHSKDSRDQSVGLVDNRYVLGKVMFRLWPVSGFGSI